MTSPIHNISLRRRLLFRSAAMLAGLLLSLVLLEIIFYFYQPFALRVRGGRISLPMNYRTVFSNHSFSKLDPEIIQTRNSIGFRGKNPPTDFDKHSTIITVGGSTTECFYLSDDRTWPARLEVMLSKAVPHVWVNNAGLDGHSTHGHLHLLDQYITSLQPKVVLFLIGLNDIGNHGPLAFDKRLERTSKQGQNIVEKSYFFVLQKSAVLALLDNFRRYRKASRAGLVHRDVSHQQLVLDASSKLETSDNQWSQLRNEHRTQYLPDYEQRVRQLVETCRSKNIAAVLVTQPALYGPAIDDLTQVDLRHVNVNGMSGNTRWKLLELYNDVTRKVAREQNLLLIDLANQMPKSSRYYYDYHHFTNDGADVVAELIHGELSDFLIQQSTPDPTE